MTATETRPVPRPVNLRDGDLGQAVFRVNRNELARAKTILGYKSVQEMMVDLVERSVDDKLFRERRVAEQRAALRLLDDVDLTDLTEITTFRP